MARRSEGEVLERRWKSGRGYALRFRAYGRRHYLTLGLASDGWDRGRAEEELANVMADVRRGLWVPPDRGGRRHADVQGPEVPPTFGEFARDLIASRQGQVAERTIERQEGMLAHVLPFFGDWRVDEIDIEAVDAYRAHKVAESEARRRALERGRPGRDRNGRAIRPLSAYSINNTIRFLRWVLAIALEYELVTRNAAAGRRRLLKEGQRRPVHLDTAAQIEALLDAAAELDREPKLPRDDRQVIVATLVLAGPRSLELGHLLWRDIDLANGRILIGRSKTQAGLREITILPILRDILAAHKARASGIDPDDLVFPTARGRRRNSDNLRGLLHQVFERADVLLGRRGHVPLPKGLGAHKLRHTFASILIATGEDPISVMAQLGHTHPGFTLRVYSHPMSRNPGEKARLKALVAGERTTETPAARSVRLDGSALEAAIRRCLRRRGGKARRAEVLAALGVELRDRLDLVDLEILPSGMLRWEANVGKARQRLVRRGVLRADSPRGVWEVDPKEGSVEVEGQGFDPVTPLESPPRLRPERSRC
ncbi:MAG: tyrosine-type recombinase/integrase [Thermoleophilia bacterium]|nr:tyrosine-type recombinase/integrase [Thermoleophilia bacterium]